MVGLTPLAYLSRVRIDLAARLLRDTGDPVGDIARGRLQLRVRLLPGLLPRTRHRARPLPPFGGGPRVTRRSRASACGGRDRSVVSVRLA
uniref:hypothetical protein n=1 Tax=Streptomyces sp. TG1A-60 TaxID=3129111 RepID=UPI00403FF2EB